MKRFIRRKAEAWRMRREAKILIGRNVHHSAIVSRQDNNDMYGIAKQFEAFAKRISTNYP